MAFFVSVFRSRDLFARERSKHGGLERCMLIGINEMFRRLRSAKLSQADTFIVK